jgi:hypothetical protein
MNTRSRGHKNHSEKKVVMKKKTFGPIRLIQFKTVSMGLEAQVSMFPNSKVIDLFRFFVYTRKLIKDLPDAPGGPRHKFHIIFKDKKLNMTKTLGEVGIVNNSKVFIEYTGYQSLWS